LLAGAPASGALLAFGVTASGSTFLLVSDRRALLLRGPVRKPEPVPSDALFETGWEIARAGVLPSTVGVAVLTAVALAFNALLAALLAGVLGGMAAAGAISWVQVAMRQRSEGATLYAGGGRLYARHPPGPGGERLRG
jgi:hypothetical protein